MKANNVIKRINKIAVKKSNKRKLIEILAKKMFPLLEMYRILGNDLKAKSIMIAKQKEDTKKILEMIKSKAYGI